jgi:hypothetical protein
MAMLRTPARALEAAALVAGGTALAVLVADKPAAVAAGVVVAYFGAAMLLGPLRAELDVPGRMTVLLIPRPGAVVFAHALVPALVTTAAAALAAAACAIGGAEPAAALVAVVLGPGLTGCAAMSARRGGRVPISVLATATASDPSGGAVGILSWLARWPAAALALAGVPLAIVGASAGGLLPALIWAVAGTGIIASLLQRDPET